jgi:Putative transposase of IS4/5 family (DUF4096)
VALLPENGRRGQQWKDHRKVINGILWKLRTGAPWRDLPSCYSPWLDRIVSHLVALFEGLEATAGYARVVHEEVEHGYCTGTLPPYSASCLTLLPTRLRIGFKASRTSDLREGHERHRVGLKDIKGALKDGYEGA